MRPEQSIVEISTRTERYMQQGTLRVLLNTGQIGICFVSYFLKLSSGNGSITIRHVFFFYVCARLQPLSTCNKCLNEGTDGFQLIIS
jgi:hypothetical protein